MTRDETAIGEHKADFDLLYDRPDPRAYLRTMSSLDYRIPELARPVFAAALAANGASTVLDVCCSYGVTAGQLGHRVGMDELDRRYAAPEVAGLSPTALLASDRAYFAARARRRRPAMLGLDVSAPAISYAVRAGLLTDGWAENLELDEPSAALATGVSEVEMLISTGGVGYVGERTFSRLLAAMSRPERLWAVIFVLRMFDYAPIAEVLDRYGLVTERVPGRTLRQRRFVDSDESQAANHDVRLRGLDPTGYEATGWYYADCFLTRPRSDADVPAGTLLGSGDDAPHS